MSNFLHLRIIFGDAQNMSEVADGSVHLVVTSPPYFNAPFDYPNLFPTYEAYLEMMSRVARELFRVLRLITLFSHIGETVLDPFLGSGTTMKVARLLGRSCIGYEIDLELLPIIQAKVGMESASFWEEPQFEVIVRSVSFGTN